MSDVTNRPGWQQRDDRLPDRLLVTYRLSGSIPSIEGYSANISKNGMFIVTRETHPPGTKLKFQVHRTNGVVLFSGIGSVRWVLAHDPAKHQLPGIGIQFVELDAQNREGLEALISVEWQAKAKARSASGAMPAKSSGPPNVAPEVEPPHIVPDANDHTPWPGAVPSLTRAVEVLAGRAGVDTTLRPWTDWFLHGLSPLELEVVTSTAPTAQTDALRKIVATVWRLTVAVETRPADPSHLDPVALEQLVDEAGQALTTITRFAANTSSDVVAVCKPARLSIPKMVHQLLHAADSQEVKAAAPVASKAGPAAQVAHAQPARTRDSISPARRRAGLVLAVCAVLMLGGAVFLSLSPARPPPLPALPTLPSGSAAVGDPSAGWIIIQNPNGSAFAAEELGAFKAKAAERGMVVEQVSRSQIVVRNKGDKAPTK